MPRPTVVIGSGRKTPYDQFSYLVFHCIPTGFQSMCQAIYYWGLVVTGSTELYETFDFLSTEEKIEETRKEFWWVLNEPDIEDMATLNWMIGLSDEEISETFNLINEGHDVESQVKGAR